MEKGHHIFAYLLNLAFRQLLIVYINVHGDLV